MRRRLQSHAVKEKGAGSPPSENRERWGSLSCSGASSAILHPCLIVRLRSTRCAVSIPSGYERHELIPNTVQGLEVSRASGIFFNLASQLQNRIVNCPLARSFPLRPRGVNKLLAREHTSGIVNE